eukprot:CAMPEP_0180532470 /NCGR_PEP_ID=MMETSP1036_2-20121128/63081_1 /TAXON_ID=632150 /ORGANISM="Azadinium spinosum, Strain 3D9" /LENGTH=72 /DNA_ID=CAMNT_0022546563 /DNA_START=101 /DNA_END=319 /DNA_ORIENTATION=-
MAPCSTDGLELVRDSPLRRGCQHGVQEDDVAGRCEIRARGRLSQREQEDEGHRGGVVLPVPNDAVALCHATL